MGFLIHSRARHRVFTPQRILGLFVSVVAGFLLIVVGWLAYQHFTAPALVAKLLPAEETFAFVTVETDRTSTAFQELTALYRDVPVESLLDFSALGLRDSETFMTLIGRRVGVAFFGHTFDPQKFALMIDTPDQDVALTYLQSELLTGEEFVSQRVAGTTMYTFARSRPLAFAFVGHDLILAADATILTKILRARAGEVPALRASADYLSTLATIDQRAPIFVYLSHPALVRAALQQVTALPAATLGSLTDLMTGLAIAGTPTATGISLVASLPTTTEVARREVLPVATYQSSLQTLVATESLAWVIGGQEVATNFQHIRSTLPAVASHTAELLTGYFTHAATELIGATTADDLLPAFAGETLVGRTQAGDLFVVLRAPAAALTTLKNQLLAGRGTLTAGTEVFTLPDGTLGKRLVAGNISLTSTSQDGAEIVRNDRLAFFTLGEFFVASSSADLTTRIADRIVAGGETPTTAEVGSMQLMPHLRLPWLLPFARLTFGLNSDPAGFTIRGELRRVENIK